MISDDLLQMPLSALSARIRTGQITSVDLTKSVLNKIDACDSRFCTYIASYKSEAMELASELDDEIKAGYYRGSLHGIPMGIKDNLYVAGRTTTIGSKIHADFIPDYSATVVEKLETAGAILLGKLNLHEYALGVTTVNPHYGICRNPWNTNRIAGGSSGGSAVAVATSMSIGSLGSDTSGSIRIPASACGIVGLKPTYGRVSKFGCFPEAWSLDHVGPMARYVDDAAVLLDAVSGYDPNDPASLHQKPTLLAGTFTGDIRGKVIGVNEAFFFKDVDSEIDFIVRSAIRELEERGAKVELVDIPHVGLADYAITIIDSCETSTVHHDNLKNRRDDYGDDVRFLIECGELPSAVTYLQAQQIRHKLQQSFERVFRKVDALVSPTLPIQVPNIGEEQSTINGKVVDTVESLMRLVGPANLLGLPALSVPCGVLGGMPVGMQIIGQPLAEDEILNIGRALEMSDIFPHRCGLEV